MKERDGLIITDSSKRKGKQRKVKSKKYNWHNY